VNTYETKVAIIGQGSWPSKIKSSLERNFQGLHVKVFSARAVSSKAKIIQKDYFHVIWIATQPSLQLKLLRDLSDAAELFIFEKPLGSNSSEIGGLIKFLEVHQNGVTAPSNPWSYVNACLETIDLMQIEGLDAANIDITRRGPNRRSYLSPVRDWIPHDLYLLGQIFKSEPISIDEISGTEESANANFYSEKFQAQISISSGFSDRRVAEIIFTKGMKRIRADFLSGRIFIDDTEHKYQVRNAYDSIARNYLDANNWGREKFLKAATLQAEVFSALEKLK